MAKGRKTGGRKPGTPNKLTADVKSAIVAAFNEVGGSAYLIDLAKDHPAVFCSLLGKVVPAEKHIELQAFRASIGENGHARFESAPGFHDDLVLAAAMAVWRLTCSSPARACQLRPVAPAAERGFY
jgi:hypothetical protein